METADAPVVAVAANELLKLSMYCQLGIVYGWMHIQRLSVIENKITIQCLKSVGLLSSGAEPNRSIERMVIASNHYAITMRSLCDEYVMIMR